MSSKQIEVKFEAGVLDWIETEQATRAAHMVRVMQTAQTLDEIAAELRARLPGWFVYQGGSHVALHRRSRAPRAVMFWFMGVK